MKRLIAFLLLVVSTFAANSIATADYNQVTAKGIKLSGTTIQSSIVGCGAGSNGADTLNQSTCGNVAPYPSALSSPTSLPDGGTLCPGGVWPCTVTAPGNYVAVSNCSIPTVKCITFSAKNVHFDFAGHTLDGQIDCEACVNNGTSEFFSSAAGGTHTCAISGTVGPALKACFYMNDGNDGGTLNFHHLTVNNTANASGTSAKYAVFETGTGASALTTVNIYNITGTLTNTSDITTSRVVMFRIQTSIAGSFYIVANSHNNDINCGDVAACNIHEYVAASGAVYNNISTLTTNTIGETSRFVIFDGEQGLDQHTRFGSAYNNKVTVNNNRFYRDRGQTGGVSHDNRVLNVTGVSLGAFHMENENGTDFTDISFTTSNEYVEVASGIAMAVRGAKNIAISGWNVVCATCTSGRFVHLYAPIAPQTESSVCAQSNTIAASIGSASSCVSGTGTNSCASAGTALKISTSGTSSGAGTITACP